MLLLLYDLYCYRNQLGRYSDDALGMSLSLGFKSHVPAEIIGDLQEGDVIFTQRLNSLTPWAIMYFSSSQIDHAAMYIGNGDVIHMTLKGARKHSIAALARQARILPVRFAPSDSDKPFDPPADGYRRPYLPAFLIRKLPPKVQFCWGGLRIAAGFQADRASWRLVVDILITAAAIQAYFGTLIGALNGIVLAVLISNLANYVRFKAVKMRGGLVSYISHPDLGYRSFGRIGGLMFTKLGTLVCSDFGVLPAHVFFALIGEGADDSTPQELQNVRERAYNTAKRWRLIPGIEEAKDEQRK